MHLVRVTLSPTNQPLHVGLSTAVSIITDKRGDVVLVPSGAIQETDNGLQVRVKRGDQTVPVQIQTGLAGDTYTEVTGGLQPGDVVVLPGPRATNRPGFGP